MNDTAPPTPAALPSAAPDAVRSRLFDEIALGDEAVLERRLEATDLQRFASLLDPLPASAVADRGWPVVLFATLLDTRLPGPGSTVLGQTLRFAAPVEAGDTLRASVKVIARDGEERRLVLACLCRNQHDVLVAEGEMQVLVAERRIVSARPPLPAVRLDDDGDDGLLARARRLGAIRVAVVHPCDETSLAAVLDARAAGLIEPLLVAPRAKLEAVAHDAGLDLSGLPIEDVAHSHAAAAQAVRLAANGRVEALMKGSLHTDELMAAVVAADAGLRTARRVSHCFLIQAPAYPRPFILTDAAVNIEPTLEDKADIVRNAIDLAHIAGVELPRIAILAAVETVNVRMRATLDAAALCKMADRGQIEGGVLDGPLAFDNAISIAAARMKGIVSPVAGVADILVVPDLESGNMLAKQLEYLGGATYAGVVMGARVPIVLTSRSDRREARIASCALAVLVAHRYRAQAP